MTRIVGLLLTGLLLAPRSTAAGELTLRDVMELHRTGLGDELLIAVIDADGGPFRLSFADIQDLKSDGLSEGVITALVRTGTRQPVPDPAETAARPVQVSQDSQELVPFVPGVVVVAAPVLPLCCVEAHPGQPSRRADRRERSQLPPAAWVTQREDGRNVPAVTRVRSAVPPATWVTPRDPQPRERRSPDPPASSPR